MKHETEPEESLTQQIRKTFKSASGLKMYLKKHDINNIPTPGVSIRLDCSKCAKQFKSLSGLKSHLRAHARAEKYSKITS